MTVKSFQNRIEFMIKTPPIQNQLGILAMGHLNQVLTSLLWIIVSSNIKTARSSVGFPIRGYPIKVIISALKANNHHSGKLERKATFTFWTQSGQSKPGEDPIKFFKLQCMGEKPL